MRNLWRYSHRVFFVSSLTLALGSLGASARAQQNPTMSTSGTMSAGAQANVNPNSDLTTQEVAKMDQFLDDHKDIDKQLEAKPSLINDQSYLNHHKDLRNFLSDHPQIREEFSENPRYFMHRENRFDAREDARFDQDRSTGGSAGASGSVNPGNSNGQSTGGASRSPNPDLNNGEVANFDRFLDSHPEVARQLEDNPQLITDQGYLKANPQLQDYLNQHPAVRGEFAETPNYFMHREERFDARTDARTGADARVGVNLTGGAGGDTDRDSARMNQWLDDHKDVAKDLRDHPERMNDQKYIDRHKDFAEFLREHPELRDRSRQNPSFFADRDRFEANRQLSTEHRARVDEFLDKHQEVARDLHTNPTLCNDDRYIARHKDYREFLSKNPGVRNELAENHQYFVERDQRMHTMKPGETRPDKTRPADSQADKDGADKDKDKGKTAPDVHPDSTVPPAKNTNPAPPPSATQQRQNLTPTAPH